MEKSTTPKLIRRAAICMMLMLSCTIRLLAQEGKTHQAHVGIIYPLSTNGKTAPSDTNNFSLHLIGGISAQENGCLFAGLSGIVKGDANGAMVSGVFNHIGNNAKGVQLAGVLNYVGHHARGAQIAGVANITDDTAGIQVAGVFNKASDANMQIAGLVNIAKKVTGIQIAGLINIAEQSDYPIGLVNIIKEGEMQLGLTVDEDGGTLVAFRSGGRVLYSILGLGYNLKNEEARYMLAGGIGMHLVTAKTFRLNAELMSTLMTSFEDGEYHHQRISLLAGYRLMPGIELFAGPTFNHLLFDTDQHDIRNNRYLRKWQGEDTSNGLYIGGILGLQFSL